MIGTLTTLLAATMLATAPAPATFDGNEGNATALTFKAVGPVARKFINDRMFISSIMGPYGSAKTTSCFQKIMNAAVWQVPNPRDGIRRIRVCVIRETYSQLETNVMKDWFAWFPKTKENWNGEHNTHTLTLDFFGISTPAQIAAARSEEAQENIKRGRCVIEMIFRGMGELKAEAVFKGMQLTLLWLNEVDTLSREVLNFGIPRVGRYPAAKDGGCAWSGVIADFNAPEVDNWTYDLLVNRNLGISEAALAQLQAQYGPEFGIAFHKQPGGRSGQAENLENLPIGYYDRLIISFAGDENKIRRFVDNKFGAVNNGQPVYPEYNDEYHVAAGAVQPIMGAPIHIGVDGGSTPAAVFGQKDELGQVRVLGECVVFNSGEERKLAKMGPTAFGRECREFFERKWPGYKIGDLWGDPAAFWGGANGGEAAEDLSWMESFGRGFNGGKAHGGKKIRPAPGTKGNRVTPRLEAVRKCLTQNVGNKPGLLLPATGAEYLRQGFNNGYVIQRVTFSDKSGRWKDAPHKNDFSHVHDALQYLVCGLNKLGDADEDGRAARIERARKAHRGNVSFGGGYFSGRRGMLAAGNDNSCNDDWAGTDTHEACRFSGSALEACRISGSALEACRVSGSAANDNQANDNERWTDDRQILPSPHEGRI